MQQYIGFTINESEYMIPILKVREIITIPAITALPQLPDYVNGVTNLRGSVIPIINTKKLLNAGGDNDSGKAVIVIFTGKIVFGIIVDGITGVVNVEKTKIESPESFFNSNIDKIEGVAKLDDKLIILLDANKLLPLADMSLLEDAIVDVKDVGDGDNVEVTKEIDTIGGKVTIKELHDAKEFFKKEINADSSRQQVFEHILQFMDALAVHDYARVETITNEIIKETNSDLFREVGRITRKLHDSLEDFKNSVDHGLDKLTQNDVPNAVDKLEFVMAKTEEAANKTMAIAERYFEESGDFMNQIEKIKGYDKEVEYLKTLKNQLDYDITEIITAQQFQDITGQTIRKVIALVNSVEVELVKLIASFGIPLKCDIEMKFTHSDRKEAKITENISKEVEKVSQADVESLLQEFGF